MKKLKFRKLWLLSKQEKKARVEDFSNLTTAVVADNDFGKSSLVKSLYATLGADPSRTPEPWKNAKVETLLEFEIDGSIYFMLRQAGRFALFDEAGELTWTGTSVVKDLGPKVGELLDFEITAKQKGGKNAIPPPAFCFLPFYLDQEKGWVDTWASFSGLDMISGYKNDIARYHTGIRPKEYYRAKALKDEATTERGVLAQERAALTKAKERFSEKRKRVGIALDVGAFEDRIKDLLKEQNALQKSYDDVRNEISQLQAQRTASQEEVEIAARVLSELEADIKFSQKLSDAEIVCPVCSTVHENDFANRFGLHNDADACRMVLLDARAKVDKLDADISTRLKSVPSLQSRIDRIHSILEETRGQVKLGDMLRDESERLVDETFEEEERVIDGDIGVLNEKIDAAKKQMSSFDKKEHKEKIIKFYADKLREFCRKLGVENVPSNMWDNIRPTIRETGNRAPRLILAYNYAVLHTINEFSTSCFCPIVVDTPLQQDPDPKNSERMISFAIGERPKGSQLVLATGSLHGVKLDGREINPERKEQLLTPDQYEAVRAQMLPFMNAVLTE
jgi:predicted  nucleic acid-binding Zn-ribbon protein